MFGCSTRFGRILNRSSLAAPWVGRPWSGHPRVARLNQTPQRGGVLGRTGPRRRVSNIPSSCTDQRANCGAMVRQCAEENLMGAGLISSPDQLLPLNPLPFSLGPT
jgi:hypothetical protein